MIKIKHKKIIPSRQKYAFNRGLNGGLVRTVILIVVALILLGYFGFNLRSIISSPVVHDNLIYAKEIAIDLWHIIAEQAVKLWDIFLNIIGNPSVERLEQAAT